MQIKGVVSGVVSVSIAWTTVAFSLTSMAAVPLQPVQVCQQRVEEELPDAGVELNPGTELPDGTVVIQWQTHTGISGSCRVAVDDNTLVEFVNPYAVPRGQRPIENVAAFETEAYTVRVLRISAQLYMNVYNRRTDRVELNQQRVRATTSEAGTTYTNLVGARRYRAIVAADGSYQLVISLGSTLVVYDQTGNSLEKPEAAVIPTRSSFPRPAQSTQD